MKSLYESIFTTPQADNIKNVASQPIFNELYTTNAININKSRIELSLVDSSSLTENSRIKDNILYVPDAGARTTEVLICMDRLNEVLNDKYNMGVDTVYICNKYNDQKNIPIPSKMRDGTRIYLGKSKSEVDYDGKNRIYKLEGVPTNSIILFGNGAGGTFKNIDISNIGAGSMTVISRTFLENIKLPSKVKRIKFEIPSQTLFGSRGHGLCVCKNLTGYADIIDIHYYIDPANAVSTFKEIFDADVTKEQLRYNDTFYKYTDTLAPRPDLYKRLGIDKLKSPDINIYVTYMTDIYKYITIKNMELQPQ